MSYHWHARTNDRILVRMGERSGRKAKLEDQDGNSVFSWHERHNKKPAKLIFGSFGDRELGAEHAIFVETVQKDRRIKLNLLLQGLPGLEHLEGPVVAGIQFARPTTHLYMSSQHGVRHFRWKTQGRNQRNNQYRVTRHLLASDNNAEVLATYEIEKNGFGFHHMVITFHRDLDPLLSFLALAGAAHHVCRNSQYVLVPKYIGKFQHPNARNK